MAITISPHILARIDAVVEANDYPNADALLDQLLAPLEYQPVDPHLASLLQAGIDDFANGRYEVLTDELWADIREEAHERYRQGERPADHVGP